MPRGIPLFILCSGFFCAFSLPDLEARKGAPGLSPTAAKADTGKGISLFGGKTEKPGEGENLPKDGDQARIEDGAPDADSIEASKGTDPLPQGSRKRTIGQTLSEIFRKRTEQESPPAVATPEDEGVPKVAMEQVAASPVLVEAPRQAEDSGSPKGENKTMNHVFAELFRKGNKKESAPAETPPVDKGDIVEAEPEPSESQKDAGSVSQGSGNRTSIAQLFRKRENAPPEPETQEVLDTPGIPLPLGVGERYVTTRGRTPFYGGNSLHMIYPDEVLDFGTAVELVEEGKIWSEVRLATGESGVIANDFLKRAPLPEPAFAFSDGAGAPREFEYTPLPANWEPPPLPGQAGPVDFPVGSALLLLPPIDRKAH